MRSAWAWGCGAGGGQEVAGLALGRSHVIGPAAGIARVVGAVWPGAASGAAPLQVWDEDDARVTQAERAVMRASLALMTWEWTGRPRPGEPARQAARSGANISRYARMARGGHCASALSLRPWPAVAASPHSVRAFRAGRRALPRLGLARVASLARSVLARRARRWQRAPALPALGWLNVAHA